MATDFNGLSQEEAASRILKYGPNEFEKTEHFYYPKLFWRQIRSPLVFILIIAGAAALVLGAKTDATVIFLAVAINTGVGMYQEGRASRALEVLKGTEKKYASVIRGGKKLRIPARELVPGDLIEFELGERVPADARLTETRGLEADESILTGEWVPVEKSIEAPVFMDTLVTSGWGRAIVAKTGFETEVGRIARLVDEEPAERSPFARSVRRLAHFLGMVTALALFLVLILGLIRGEPFGEMLLLSLAIAVSIIPEGLPIAVTVILALGMERILKVGGLVKNLAAAETLGSTTLIITDKTGTLTKGNMTVAGVIAKSDAEHLPALTMALRASEAFIENPGDELHEWKIRGRPMDVAIMKAALEHGLDIEATRSREPRIDYLPFESARRYSASLHRLPEGVERLYVMGSPELLLSESKLTDAERGHYLAELDTKTKDGLRAISIAYRDGNWGAFDHRRETLEAMIHDMTFAGIIVFHDPLREDVPLAIKTAREAGIRSIMATGDSLPTARTIARESGILEPRDEGRRDAIVDGELVSGMSDAELRELLPHVRVFARVLPEQKLRIARAAESRNEIVAMTGDGVNDAPALRHANIGLALGSGTEVAKEAADMILLNDSFSVIVTAIREGRRIVDNLKKVVAFLLSTGFSEVMIVLASIMVGSPLPILPAQILWTNIVGEGVMTFAFAFEPAEAGVMRRSPRDLSNREIVTRRMKHLILAITLVTAAVLLLLYFTMLRFGRPIEEIRALMFFGVAIDSMLFVFSLKDLSRPVWKMRISSNPYLVYAFLINFSLLIAAFVLPPMKALLGVPALGALDFILMGGIALVNIVTIECMKFLLFYNRVSV